MHDIFVSVIVPIYQVEAYILQCLDSLNAQTLQNIEFLLVNDGSTDQSGEIAKRYAQQYPNRFRYFEKPNSGLSEARNFAFPYVRGKYIGFVDSDDYIAPNFYEFLWKNAEKYQVEIVECEIIKVYPAHRKQIHLPDRYRDITDYMLYSRVCVWNKLYRTDWLNTLQFSFPSGFIYEDLCFFLKITPFLTQLSYTIHEPLYYYRQRPDSLLHQCTNKMLDFHVVFSNVLSSYQANQLTADYKSILEYKYVKTLFCSYLKRALQIRDHALRQHIIVESIHQLETLFPSWRQNIFLQSPTLRNLYLRTFSHIIKLLYY